MLQLNTLFSQFLLQQVHLRHGVLLEFLGLFHCLRCECLVLLEFVSQFVILGSEIIDVLFEIAIFFDNKGLKIVDDQLLGLQLLIEQPLNQSLRALAELFEVVRSYLKFLVSEECFCIESVIFLIAAFKLFNFIILGSHEIQGTDHGGLNVVLDILNHLLVI